MKLLETIDAYARARDPRVRQVSISFGASWQVIEILRGDGESYRDVRPLVRVNISVVVGKGDRQEAGSHGYGGREDFSHFLTTQAWQAAADDAVRQALVNLEAVPAPAGEMDVVLAPGWPGIMLHEAVGHGLEGDFNRKKTSAFAGLMGQRVASKGVTVVDDGTIAQRRGSLSIDDEGTPTSRTVLIEDGVLVGYMQDRHNARLMGMKPTGNGRRQSYAHAPMPRMTNTYMLAGEHAAGEIIASVKDGIYAVNFGGGQVDITSGKYVFQVTEAYKIDGGKLGRPLKGAMLIGNGPTDLNRIGMIGNDFELDPGIGTCGKNGQGVPVGVGQPTLRLRADRLPVAAESHGQLAVPVAYQFVTCARTRAANALATAVGGDAVIATSAFIREPLATRNTRCYVRRRQPRPRYRAKGRRRLWRAPASLRPVQGARPYAWPRIRKSPH